MLDKIIQSKKFYLYFFLCHFLIWTTFYLFIDIPADMADHWVWSFYLSSGYYEHPPMIAFLMKLVPKIDGSYVLSLKIYAIFISMLVLYTAYIVCSKLFDYQTANIFLIILESTAYFSVGSVFLHIDQPFLIFWLLSTFFFVRFIQTENKKYFILVGILAGFGALSKYIMLLFYFGVFFFCISNKKYRSLLLSPHFYSMGLISLLIFSPVIYWNMENNWVSFERNFSKGTSGQSFFAENFLPFTIGHFLLFSPLFAPISFYQFFKKKFGSILPNNERNFLYIVLFCPIVFFTFFSLFGTISDPNWLNISYIFFFMLLARSIYLQAPKLKKYFLHLTSISFFFTLFLISILLYLIYNPTNRTEYIDNRSFDLVMWDKTAKIIEQTLKEKNITYPNFLISRDYMIPSKLTLYMKNNPLSHTIERSERNQWSKPEDIEKHGGIIICPPDECDDITKSFKKIYPKNTISYIDQVETHFQDFVIRKYKLYQLHPIQ